jgi:spermidine synthase
MLADEFDISGVDSYDAARMQDVRPSRLRLTLILLCFSLSGAAGLVYQVAWGKALGLVFGNTVYAIATVLAVFMGGLALGSVWWGLLSERRADCVRLYAWMEMAIAASGALSLAGLAGVRRLYVATYHAAAGSGATLLLLRFVGAAIVLLLPTFLMGGTLPVLVRGLTRQSAELGQRLSRLYWVNTAGAVAGTLLAGFFLLPAVGLRGTVGVAVALNVVAGLVAAALTARSTPGKAEAGQIAGSKAATEPTGRGTREAASAEARAKRVLLVCFGIVGATAIAYEVAWTRLLVTFFGSSTYAFTVMLATFLAGIVLGSMLFEWWAAPSRGRDATLAAFATTQSLTGVAALAFLLGYQHIPQVVTWALELPFAELPAWIAGPLGLGRNTFGALTLAQCVACASAMLPAAIVFGFNFPLVTVLVARRQRVPGVRQGASAEATGHGAAVGKAYAANTVGAIAGAVLTGFFLIPRMGAFRLVAVLALANLLLSVFLLAHAPGRRIVALTANAALIAAAAFSLLSGQFYNAAVATFSPFLYYDPADTRLTIAESAQSYDILYARDGLNATISVAASEDYLALRTNGKVDAGNRDIDTQLFSGHVGPVFHPAPRQVLVIGFGSGMTVAAVARYADVEHIDVVEIEPGIIEAAPLLERLNRGVLRDPRVRVILDDGRNFLLTTRESYDLIVSEPSNPWIAGVASLFTDEFYAQARAHLRPGGMLLQWVQGYSLFLEDFRMVLATVAAHFESVTVWRGEEPDFLLLAREESAPLPLDRVRERLKNPGIAADFEKLGVFSAEGIVALHRLDNVDLRRLLAGAELNTDDNSLLEFHAPRTLLQHGLVDENINLVWGARTARLPRDIRVEDAHRTLLEATETALQLDDRARTADFLKGLAQEPPTADLELLRARLAQARGVYDDARVHFQAALHLDPHALRAARGLADVARLTNDLDSAELLYRQILARDPENLPAMAGLVKVLDSKHQWADGAAWLARKLKLDPDPDASEFALLGDFLGHLSRLGDAEEMYREAIRREPYSYSGHRGLGDVGRAERQWISARENYEFVVRYFPGSASGVYLALSEVYRNLGEERRARATLRKGLRIFPDDVALQRVTPRN